MLDEMKELYWEKEGKEISDSEAYEAASNLIGLAELIMDLSIKEQKRKQRLKKEPNGFLLEEGYTCSICHGCYPNTEKWYHWYGIACTYCRKAVADGIVPAFVAQHRESWYGTWQLQDKFGIKSPTARKMVRNGELVARIVPDENGKPLEYIFLKKENPKFIDPNRYSPARKSWNRNRDKVSEERIREEMQQMEKPRNKKH